MAGSLFVLPRQTPVNGSGRPYPGATLTFYAAGTSTLTTVYADSAASVPLQNPLPADSSGQFPAIYTTASVRAVLKDASGQVIWTEDNIPPGGSDGGGSTGPTGPSGLSVAEVAIYQRAPSQPATPSGGSYSFVTQTLTPPSGWQYDIPDGFDPVWTCRAVAAVDGSTGTDSTLAWSTPVRVYAEGASVDIIFKRSASQPATPAPSPGVPATWYTDVDSVPASSNTLWSSVGTRDNPGQDWTWQLPIQVEGDQGPQGVPAELYYILPIGGTAIKNGSGVLTVEAHKLTGGVDTKLSSGTIKLYVGTTEVTVANGFYTGSDGYTGKFDSGDISGASTVILKDGPSGAALDTCTLVDVADGSSGGVTNAVYGYVDAPFLAWTRASDQTTWTPAASTCKLDCTFVQGGVDVARVAYTLTRAADGTLTGTTSTHTSGDLNSGRIIAITTSGSGTTVFSTKFTYSFSGDTSIVVETVYSSLAGGNGATGPTGPTGPSPLTMALTKKHIPLQTFQNGSVVSYSTANGLATIWRAASGVTATATLSATASGCTGTINTAVNTPINGQPKGYYQVTAMAADTATLTLSATESGDTVSEIVTLSRVNVGYEIVTSLPATNLFLGRIVFLTTDGKLYRYNGTAWTREVDGADLKANSVTTNSINAGAITAAKISVSQLSAVSANLGTITAGVIQAGSGQVIADYNNARILFDTAPGQAGVGYVRIQGYGFGPTNQYIDWYGPKPAAASTFSQIVAGLTDGAALSFQKIDGTFVSTGRQRGEFEVKAWGKWQESASGTVTMLDRFNIASMTYASVTGRISVVFATPLPNPNYAVCVSANNGTTATDDPLIGAGYGYTTTGFNIKTIGSGGNANRAEAGSFIVFGSNVVGTTTSASNVVVPTGGFGGGTWGKGYIP